MSNVMFEVFFIVKKTLYIFYFLIYFL
jgi:hypothetical protein